MSSDPNSVGQVPPSATASPTLDSAAPYAGAAPTKDDQNLAVLCYILGIFTWCIGPLIIWLMKKDSSKFVDDQGKEVINWGITTGIAWMALFIVGFVLILIPILGWILSFLLHLSLFAIYVVFNIMGAMQASKGAAYRYPFALRLIK